MVVLWGGDREVLWIVCLFHEVQYSHELYTVRPYGFEEEDITVSGELGLKSTEPCKCLAITSAI